MTINKAHEFRIPERVMAAVVASALVAVAGVSGAAPAMDIGKREFQENCVSCHGESGKGDGRLAGIINQPISDLTVLATNNDGIFPFARVYEVIDGTRDVVAHGGRDMPVWGSVYNDRAPQWLGFDYTPRDSEGFVRGRILPLIGYLQTLQGK